MLTVDYKRDFENAIRRLDKAEKSHERVKNAIYREHNGYDRMTEDERVVLEITAASVISARDNYEKTKKEYIKSYE